MKRSRAVQRLLLGGLTAGALTGGAAAQTPAPRVTPDTYFTNDAHIPGVGWYHAPYQGFYAHPYNHYDAQRKQYYHGGTWSATPHRSIINISAPRPEAAQQAERLRTDLPRGGFGRSSGSHFIPT